MSKNKIAFLCVASDDFKITYERCLNSQIKYCEKNNYDHLIFSDINEYGVETSWYWKKIYLAKHFLKEYQYIVIIDADCEIRTTTPNLEEILDKNHIYYVLGISNRPNSGFLIIRNSERGSNFIDSIIDKRNKECPDNYRSKGENGHVIWAIAENNLLCKELPIIWNCSQKKYLDTAYIIHYTNEMRYEI